MLVLNVLSLVLGWITHSYVLGNFVSLLMVGFALGNAVLGAYLAWRLVHS